MISEFKKALRHSVAQNAGVLAVAQYIAAGLGLITTVISARLLGPNDYGQAVIILAYPSLLLSLASFKSVAITTRYLASFRGTDQKEKLRAICKAGYGIDFGAFLLSFVLVVSTGWWITHHIYSLPTNMFWLMMIYASSFPFLSFRGTSFAVLTAFEEFRLHAVLSILDQGITLILVVTLLAVGLGVSGMVLGMAAGHIMIGLVALSMATSLLSRSGIDTCWKASFESIKSLRYELLSFFGWNYLMVTLSGLLTQVPLMLLGKFRGSEEAGFYRLAMSLISGSSHAQRAAARVVYPRLSARWSLGERESLDRTLKGWTLRGGLPLAALMLLTIPLLPVILPVVFGAGYDLMVRGAQMMMAGTAVSALFFWLHPFYYASGRIGLWTKAYGLYTVLIIGLAWFCIHWWGFFGLAGLVALGEILFTISAVSILATARGKLQREASSSIVERR